MLVRDATGKRNGVRTTTCEEEQSIFADTGRVNGGNNS